MLVERFEDGSYGAGAAGGEFSAVLVGGLDGEGEEDGGGEGDDREDEEGEGADAADVAEGVFGGGGVGVGVVAEVDFADPGGAVEEEGEPAWDGKQMLWQTWLGGQYQSRPRIGSNRWLVFGLGGAW